MPRIMACTVAWMIVFMTTGHVFGDEPDAPPGPAAQRGWIVVVRGPGGSISADLTEELPGKYAMRAVRDPSGLEVWVFDNERLRLTTFGADEWSVVASRCYQGVGFLFTHLIFLDPPPQEFTDRQALDLLLAYKSFAFGDQRCVILCPPRAQVTWESGLSMEPITDGECKTDATLTISLDKRTPTVLKARLLKVERGMGRILVDQGVAPK